MEDSDKAEDLGTVEISHEVIGTIAAQEATEVPGVICMSEGIGDGLARKLKGDTAGKGVRIRKEDDKLHIDLSVVVEYGVSIPKLSSQIQLAVLEGLRKMTESRIGSINVSVNGIELPRAREPEERES